MHETDAGRREARGGGPPPPETDDFWPPGALREGVPRPLPGRETDRAKRHGRDPSHPSPDARRTASSGR
jgi:hypothetical protein